MTTEKTLLQQIREKELLLNIKIEDTRREADEAVLAAEKEASAKIEEAERTAKEAARVYYDREIEKVNKEIEQLKDQGTRQALSIKEAGKRNLPRAIEKIVKAVSME